MLFFCGGGGGWHVHVFTHLVDWHWLCCSNAKLHQIAASLHLVPPQEREGVSNLPRQFLMDLIISCHERRLSQIDALNEMPLFPTEQTIWDENLVPTEFYSDGCLALPKLNTQFLTIHDYLLRNLNLFRMESTYEIRQDMEDTIPRLKAFGNATGETGFAGWSRMAQPITSFTIVEVGRPKLGEMRPSSVRADVTLHMNVQYNVKQEWESLRRHDIGFLVSIRALPSDTRPVRSVFLALYGSLAACVF